MNNISIIDNYNSFVNGYLGPFDIKRLVNNKDYKSVIEDLKIIAGKSLVQLKEENPNLLIFPEDLGALQDGFKDKEKTICSLYPSMTCQFLETGNVMGWIGCGNTQLKIFSRFDSNLYDNDNNGPDTTETKKLGAKNDFFMYYILSKLGAFHLTSLDYTKDNDGNFALQNLLALMFPAFLKNAVSQGLYKEYRTFKRNDANVRGVININQHIRRNNPFVGKVAYSTREFSFDNDITQLIRHTIEYIEGSSMGSIILGGDAETRQCIDVIRQATPTYKEKDRGRIINSNLRPKMHPYYTDYISLQKLCMQILRDEGINYGINSEDKVHGILFDGAWLWEAYVFTLLEKLGSGFIHPDNIAKTNALKLFKTREETAGQFNEENRDAYPDFYNDNCVLDAKYKHLEKGVRREDLYQVISYMHTMPRKIGGYIYPYQSKEEKQEIQTKSFELEGNGGLIFTIPFKIPYYDKKGDWVKFVEAMKEAEKLFMEDISYYVCRH